MRDISDGIIKDRTLTLPSFSPSRFLPSRFPASIALTLS